MPDTKAELQEIHLAKGETAGQIGVFAVIRYTTGKPGDAEWIGGSINVHLEVDASLPIGKLLPALQNAADARLKEIASASPIEIAD